MAATQSVQWGALGRSFWPNFLGGAPDWYKWTIIAFLVANPALYALFGGFIAGWVLVLQFIFTLAMALRCYPLQSGGLLAIEALVMGLTTAGHVYYEVESNLKVILLLVFMVAGIFFMKELLLFTFTKILLGIRNKTLLSLLFCFVAAVLSAFLDALTVMAVVITVAAGFFGVYQKFLSDTAMERLEAVAEAEAGGEDEEMVPELLDQRELEGFRVFLCGLVMHAAVGTALGGVTTIVGEPQNVVIADKLGWDFQEFFIAMMPVTLPVLGVGLLTCVVLERLKVLGYGTDLPEAVRVVLTDSEAKESASRTSRERARLVVQAIAAVLLIFALAFTVAEIGLIGLALIVLQTAFNGIVEEHRIGPAFEEALPFTGLLCVFFAIVAVISDQGLFQPVIDYVLTLPASQQPGVFYIANGLLSVISDNVFVATVYIGQVEAAFNEGVIGRRQFELLGVAINTGTNIPSVGTPNGQAAFLFLLTSSLAPMIQLSYGRMVLMALPYTATVGVAGWLAVVWLLCLRCAPRRRLAAERAPADATPRRPRRLRPSCRDSAHGPRARRWWQAPPAPAPGRPPDGSPPPCPRPADRPRQRTTIAGRRSWRDRRPPGSRRPATRRAVRAPSCPRGSGGKARPGCSSAPGACAAPARANP